MCDTSECKLSVLSLQRTKRRSRHSQAPSQPTRLIICDNHGNIIDLLMNVQLTAAHKTVCCWMCTEGARGLVGANGQQVLPIASTLVPGGCEGLWLPALQRTNCVVKPSAIATGESPMEAPPALGICHFLQQTILRQLMEVPVPCTGLAYCHSQVSHT